MYLLYIHVICYSHSSHLPNKPSIQMANNQHGVVIFENILSIWYKRFVDNYTHTMRMQNMWNGCNYIIIHQKGISFTMLERY